MLTPWSTIKIKPKKECHFFFFFFAKRRRIFKKNRILIGLQRKNFKFTRNFPSRKVSKSTSSQRLFLDCYSRMSQSKIHKLHCYKIDCEQSHAHLYLVMLFEVVAVSCWFFGSQKIEMKTHALAISFVSYEFSDFTFIPAPSSNFVPFASACEVSDHWC